MLIINIILIIINVTLVIYVIARINHLFIITEIVRREVGNSWRAIINRIDCVDNNITTRFTALFRNLEESKKKTKGGKNVY